jgi:hypothetical protein
MSIVLQSIRRRDKQNREECKEERRVDSDSAATLWSSIGSSERGVTSIPETLGELGVILE